jgi:hypothetical protein
MSQGSAAKPRRARTVAIQTVLGWNVVPVAALSAAVWGALSEAKSGEDWSGVVVVILAIVGGGAVVLATGVGVAVAAMLMTRILRAGHAGTTALGFGWGTLSALLGWVAAVAIIAVLVLTKAVGIRAAG